ncbi:MAG: succinate dehydrogenase cytochrome b subunit [Verrucomicrobiaceae bacterium]|nr:MAG: succinate dehydrogenase cytochrome b subunit [Verrucomicrobiaceae bacterium]
MNPYTFFWKSSIGKKWLVALTGLVWVGYVFGHLIGNLQVFAGPQGINAYAELLHSKPLLLWMARIFLIISLVLHIVATLKIRWESRQARPVPYAKKADVQAKLAAKTMAISGLTVLAFIIYHLLHLTIRATDSRFKPLSEGGLLQGTSDVYTMMVLGFGNPIVSLFYVIGVGLLCMHLSHGFSSMLQTLGINSRKLMTPLSLGGRILAALVFIGYASIPIGVWSGALKLTPPAVLIVPATTVNQ